MLRSKHHSIFYLFNLLFFLSTIGGSAQQMNPEKTDSLIVESIKESIWIPFMESYRELDTKKFAALYTSDVTRVSLDLNKIESGTEFFESMNSFFERVKNMKLQMNITFSIVSSATENDKVYQTGYYTVGFRKNDEEPFQSTGYAQFEVLLIKEKGNGSWKIFLDTDKSAKLTEEEFLNSGVIYKLE